MLNWNWKPGQVAFADDTFHQMPAAVPGNPTGAQMADVLKAFIENRQYMTEAEASEVREYIRQMHTLSLMVVVPESRS